MTYLVVVTIALVGDNYPHLITIWRGIGDFQKGIFSLKGAETTGISGMSIIEENWGDQRLCNINFKCSKDLIHIKVKEKKMLFIDITINKITTSRLCQ